MATMAQKVKSAITVETLVAEFEEVRQLAVATKKDQPNATNQLNAANTAIKGKAVLTGKWVERAEFGEPGEFDHMSDEELLTAIRERFAKLESEIN